MKTTLEAFLAKLHKNYQVLKLREAKYANVAPLDLLNQIDDYEHAIAIGQDALENGISLERLQTEFDSLNLEIDAVVFVSQEPPRKIFTGECPYRGLHKFTETDANFFFGREQLVQELLTTAHQLIEGDGFQDISRLIPVLGASGSGKSSLVRAGLIPALLGDNTSDSANWLIKVMQPGGHPLDALSELFVGELNRSLLNIRYNLNSGKKALDSLIRDVLIAKPANKGFVLIIDQFEELFALCESIREKQIFLDQILYASKNLNGKTLVVLTMRTDFYGKVSQYPDLARVITHNQMLVGPMTQKELRAAILLPAEKVGLEIEKDLAHSLILETLNEPGGLPLMQHALLELFKRRDGNLLTMATYDEIGGIQGAIAYHADGILKELSPDQRDTIRRVFMRLIQVNDDKIYTRRRITQAELISSKDDLQNIESIVKILSDGNLLVTDHSPDKTSAVVDVAHEALIEGWPSLHGWLEQDKSGFLTRQRIRKAAEEWQILDYDKDALLRGRRLQEAKIWLASNPDEINLLEHKFLMESLNIPDKSRSETKGRIVKEDKSRGKTGAFKARRILLFTGIAIIAIISIFALQYLRQSGSIDADGLSDMSEDLVNNDIVNFLLNLLPSESTIPENSLLFNIPAAERQTIVKGLGTPVDRYPRSNYARQYFEGGLMFWWENPAAYLDPIYVIHNATSQDQGNDWSRYENTWTPDEPMVPDYCPEAGGPNGPVMGFGRLWCYNGAVKKDLGAAIAPEEAKTDATIEMYSDGIIFSIPLDGQIWVLLNDGTWKTYPLQ